MSLYAKLFRYRTREGRTPLEDYLTEALGDLLNRMPRSVMDDFVSKLLLGQDDAKAAWSNLVATNKPFNWNTQRQIVFQGKPYRLDLLLEVDGHPVLVVESKIGHHLAIHEHVRNANAENTPGDAANKPIQNESTKENQLVTYGRWLALQTVPDLDFQALSMISHSTAPPDDFGKSNHSYGVAWTRACRWSEVWRWLIEIERISSVNSEDQHHTWKALSRDLASFIEEMGMSIEMIDHADISKVEVFISSGARINATFKMFADKLKPILAEKSSGRITGEVFYAEGGVMWSWVYLKPPAAPPQGDWALSWGIRFPSVSGWWKEAIPPLPHAQHVFVHLSGEKIKLPLSRIAAESIPQGWSSVTDTDELVAGKSIYDFPPRSDDMNNAMADWIKEKVQESFSLLNLLNASTK